MTNSNMKFDRISRQQ